MRKTRVIILINAIIFITCLIPLALELHSQTVTGASIFMPIVTDLLVGGVGSTFVSLSVLVYEYLKERHALSNLIIYYKRRILKVIQNKSELLSHDREALSELALEFKYAECEFLPNSKADALSSLVDQCSNRKSDYHDLCALKKFVEE